MEDAQTARTRSFLAWHYVWINARACTIIPGDHVVLDGSLYPLLMNWSGPPALSLMVWANMPLDELETRFDSVGEYEWEVRS
jgi:hypothetical protein